MYVEICLERSDFGGRHSETVLAARLCLCDVIRSNSKLAEGKKPATEAPFIHGCRQIFAWMNFVPGPPVYIVKKLACFFQVPN